MTLKLTLGIQMNLYVIISQLMSTCRYRDYDLMIQSGQLYMPEILHVVWQIADPSLVVQQHRLVDAYFVPCISM